MATIRTINQPPELAPLLSADRPVWLFKHSLTCGVSARALRELESFAGSQPESAGLFVKIEVQRARELSSLIAQHTGVRHQSPQVLLLRSGRLVWHESHWRISVSALAEAEAEAAAGEAAAAAPAGASR